MNNNNIEKIKRQMNKPLASNGVSLVRWGGLTMVRQRGNYDRATCLSAPERYGFYAFLFPFIDLFLISSTKKTEFNAGVRKEFHAISGVIWTHIKPDDPSMILDVHGNWFKVDVFNLNKIVQKAFAVESSVVQSDHFFENHETRTPWKCYEGKELKVQRVNAYGGYGRFTDKLEVFVCRDTKIT